MLLEQELGAGCDAVCEPGTRSSQSQQLVVVVKILFSLITVIIPQKLYKVHSILRSGGDRRRGGPFGLEASPVDSNKGSPAGLGDTGGGGPIVKNKCGSVKK